MVVHAGSSALTYPLVARGLVHWISTHLLALGIRDNLQAAVAASLGSYEET